MYNLKKKEEILQQFIETADMNLELVKSYGNLAECMEKDDADMVKYLIKEAVKVVRGSVPEELDVPAISVLANQSGDAERITVIDLGLRNKYSSEIKFNFKKQIVFSEDVFEVLADFIKFVCSELIVDALIRANLEVVNAKLKEIGEKAGNTFTVRIVSPLACEGHKVVSILDEEVVFVADETRILSMDDILLFFEPNEVVSQEAIDKAYEETVAEFAKAQTTPQFLGVHEPLVGYICDISKLVKPITIIKKVYSKNVKNLHGKRDTLAYFNNGEVFAVVSATAEGKEVVLKPFNIETLEVVDFDVLAEI